jgi:trypsin
MRAVAERPVRRGAALLAAALAAAMLLAVSARCAGAMVVSGASGKSPAEVRAYWTPQRMEAAEPLDLPQLSDPKVETDAASTPDRRSVEIPPSSGAATYDFQPGGETSFPQSVHGKVFFTIDAGDGGPPIQATCSGTLVSSLLRNVVFTAGHCVQYPGYAPSTNLVFVPGYRDGAEPFGEFPAATLLAPQEWVRDSDPSFDVAIAQLSSPLELTLGARGIAFNKPPRTAYKIFGYPAEPVETYDGERLVECDAPFLGLELGLSHPFSTIVYPCDMGGGSSGGGWVNPKGEVVSVVSHGYTNPALAGQMVGPFFGDAVKRLYNEAGGSAQCPPARQAAKLAQQRVKKARKAAKRSDSEKARKKLRKANRRLGKAKSRRDAYC